MPGKTCSPKITRRESIDEDSDENEEELKQVNESISLQMPKDNELIF